MTLVGFRSVLMMGFPVPPKGSLNKEADDVDVLFYALSAVVAGAGIPLIGVLNSGLARSGAI